MGTLSGGEIVTAILKSYKVTHLFTLCGGHISPIFVTAKQSGIEVIDVRDEAHAVFAADAMSRLTGTVGVATVTAGPGVTNTITALVNAKLAQSPLVLLGGAAPTLLKGRGALQDIDQMSLIKSNVKWCKRAKKRSEIGPLLNQAFQVAVADTPGPVFLELPVDILYPEELVREWYEKDKPKGSDFTSRAISWYMQRHVNRLFANYTEPPLARNQLKPVKVDRQKLKMVADKIKLAKRPLLLVGSGGITRPQEVEKLSESIKKLGIPVFLSGMARGLTGREHQLQFRHRRKQALKSADLVILAGVSFDFRMNYGRGIGKGYMIGINRNKKDLTLNRKPNMAILSDPQQFLTELSEHLDIQISEEWRTILNQNEEERELEIEKSKSVANDGIDPIELFQSLDQNASADAVFVANGGDFVGTASYIIRPRGPLRWLDPGVFGTLGVAGGFGLASKIVRKESEVYLILGDGSSAYSLMEVDSMMRHKLPVTIIIGNDACWNQIARDQVEMFNDNCATELDYSNYEVVGQAFGAKGEKVLTIEEFENALVNAKKANNEGYTYIINAILTKSDFRKGSISM